MKALKKFGLVVGALIVVIGLFLAWMAGQLAPDVRLGAPAPDVTLASLDGTPLPLASLRGQVVLLDFWSST